MNKPAFFPQENFDHNTCWNAEQSKMIQALSCIGVMTHHVTQQLSDYGNSYIGPITVFSSMGILFTALFFFYSGFGLLTSVSRKSDYLDHFLSHRLPVILVPFWMSNLIGILIRLYVKQIPTSPKDILICLLGYRLLNGNGWYFVEIIFLYLLFYFLFKTIKNKDLALLLLCLGTLCVIYIGFRNGHDAGNMGSHWFMGEWWYNSTVAFIMGALFARFKEPVVSFFSKHFYRKLLITAVGFVLTFALEEKIRLWYGYYQETIVIDGVNSKLVTLLAQSLVCLVWVLLVLLLNMRFPLRLQVWKKIGIISPEVFLLHGYILNDFRIRFPIRSMLYLYVILCGLLFGALLHTIDAPLIRLFQRICRKEKKQTGQVLRKDRIRTNRKKLVIATGIIIVAVLLYLLISSLLHDSAAYKKELQQLSCASVGDTVSFGEYNTLALRPGKEQVEWLVLKKENRRLMLLTKQGIAGGTYYQTHTEIDWKDSDLCQLLNNRLYSELFSKEEQNLILPNPETGDLLSLLSAEEALTLFPDDTSRQLDITEIAKKNGTNVNQVSKADGWDLKGYRSSWWWLRGTEKSITAPIVSVDGEVQLDKKYVNKPSGALRPVVWVEIP